ncbi:hypothetical protein AB0I66_18710 [Streptomyces sp. NPDC050439]|uniref:hypothetical protein n=1 Tax=unclassified Streptomyces TaxID=2593676 RepID=UPI003436D4C5
MQRMRILGVVSGIVGAAALLTACGNETAEPPRSAAGPHSGEAGLMCFWAGTEPPPPTSTSTSPDPTSIGCPEQPSPSPSPTVINVVMTPQWKQTYGWRNPVCSPRRPTGVTRHGTELRCREGGDGWTWRWSPRPHEEMSCVDAGEWSVMSSGWGLVCRDGMWRRERLDDTLSRPREPSPSDWPSQGPGKIPNPLGLTPDDSTAQNSH